MPIIHEALAHEAIFPHVHPHPEMSAAQDFALTVLFLAGLLAVGRICIGAARKLLAHGRFEKDRD